MNAVAKTPLGQVQSVRQLLVNDGAKAQLNAVAAKHMNPERLMRVTANAIRTTPKLQECDPMSFLGALMQCAALGLEPNTVMGHAYLIPFKNGRKGITEVQLIVGYRGLIDLARRSGHIKSISAHVHYSDDIEWIYEEGSDPKLVHVPGDQEGTPLHAYAVARFTDGGFAQIVMPWKKIMAVRDGSQGWQTAKKFGSTAKSPWSTHEAEMAKKTTIRALAKYLPLSVEFQDAVQVDVDGGKHVDYASFAQNPDQGGAIIDGEATDADADESEPEPEEVDKPTPDDAKKAPAAKEKLKEDPAPTDKVDAPEFSLEDCQKAYSDIQNSLLDGMPVDTVRTAFQEIMAVMKDHYPKILESVEKELGEWAKVEAKS